LFSVFRKNPLDLAVSISVSIGISLRTHFVILISSQKGKFGEKDR